MAKITIKEEEVTRFKENPKTLQEIFMYAIWAEDVEAIKLLCELTPIKSHIDKKALFDALTYVVYNDKNLNLVELVIDGLEIDLSKQTSPDTGGTLLTLAACYGSVAIGNFLLNRNFDSNHQDITEQTALHYAVIYDKKPFVNLLHNHQANLNIQDSNGYTALHLTALYKHRAMAKKLEDLRADTTIKDKRGYNYKKLREDVIKQKNEFPPPKLPSIESLEYLNLYKGIVSFYKAMLLDKNREEYILTTIDSLEEFLNPLTKPSANVSPAKELPVSVPIEEALRTLAAVYECYKENNNSAELKDYIIEKAKYWEAFVVLAMLYNTICVEYLDNADYYNARRCAELAYDNINRCTKAQDNSLQELLYNIFYNLGKVWKYFDKEISIQYFIKAEELIAGDQDTVKELLNYYIICHNVEKSLEQINKITDPDLKTLYSIKRKSYFQHDGHIIDELKEHAQSTEDAELRKLYTIMLEFVDQTDSTIAKLCEKHGFTFPKLGKPENLKYVLCVETWAEKFSQEQPIKAINCYQELSTHTERYIIPTYLFKILELCKYSNSWREGLEHLTTMYEQYSDILSNHTMLPLKYLEFIFYEANDCQQQSKDCWDFLETHAKSGDIASRLFSYAKDFALYIAIEKNDFTKASEYLNSPLVWDIKQTGIQSPRLDEATKEATKLRLLLEKLQKIGSLTTEQTPSVATEKTSFTEEIVAIESTENPDELNELVNTLYPKAIHAYFQQKKKGLLQKPIEATVKEPPCVWNTHTGVVYSSDQEDVYPVTGKENFYAVINRKLVKKLEKEELLTKFTDALLKGFTGREQGSNGIKFLSTTYELKITGDDRLYTKHVYTKQGKFLIDFDNWGGHQEVTAAINAGPLETTECEISYIPNIPQETKKTETSYSLQHITREIEHVSISEEEGTVELSGYNKYYAD